MSQYKKISFTKAEYETVRDLVASGYPSLEKLKTKMENAMAPAEKQEFDYFKAQATLAVYSRFTFDSKPSPFTIKQVNDTLRNEFIDADMLVKAYLQAERSWQGNIYFPTFMRNCKRLYADALSNTSKKATVIKRPGFFNA